MVLAQAAFAILPVLFTANGDSVDAAAKPQGLYVGQVGKTRATACFELDTDESSFYEDGVWKTFDLRVIADDWHRLLQSEPSHSSLPSEFDEKRHTWWQISPHGVKIVGARHGEDRADERIDLKRVSGACAPGFEAARLNRPATVLRKEVKGDVTFTITAHPSTGITGSLIAVGLSNPALTRINSELTLAQADMNAEWVVCSDYEGSVLPLFATSRWVAFAGTASRYCGGFHPFYEAWTLSFDAADGERIRFEDWIDTEYIDNGRVNDDLWKPILAAMHERENFDACIEREQKLHDDVGLRAYELFEVSMTLDGFDFHLDVDDPSALQCAGDYMVGFDEMRHFIKPDMLETYDSFVASAKRARISQSGQRD